MSLRDSDTWRQCVVAYFAPRYTPQSPTHPPLLINLRKLSGGLLLEIKIGLRPLKRYPVGKGGSVASF